MEKVYHYFWNYRIMRGYPLRLVDGRELVVFQPGRHNDDAGPDFSGAVVSIDGQHWAGNVEIHVRASDWYRHGHHEDPAYDNVILHVVGINDRGIERADGSLIPQFLLEIEREAFEQYAALTEGVDSIRCRPRLALVPALVVRDWVETLSMERLQSKALHIADIYDGCGHDWRQTLFITLARALGFGLNSEPFEMLARQLPLNFALRHSDNPFQIEALLFGLSGMLDSSLHIFDEYYQELCREAYFLMRKYGLRPLRPDIWKYARTRPQNFPHRRIALLARMLSGGFSLHSSLLNASSEEDIRQLLGVALDGYWSQHFDFDTEAVHAPCRLGRPSIDLLLINAVAPYLYAIGSMRGDDKTTDRAIEIQELLPPERNAIVKTWEANGIRARNARESQALIHLRKNYCDASECLRCRIGHSLLRSRAVAPSQNHKPLSLYHEPS